MKQDFTKAKIYKITNDFNDDIYVGSTCDTLVRRFISHKADSTRERFQNRSLYKLMNEIGFERFRIQLIEDYPCEDLYQIRQREGFWIRQIGTLNQRIESRTGQEYHEDNKDKINLRHREHWKEVKDATNEKRREEYAENKEKIRVRIICQCGAEICKRDKAAHERTKKHLALINNI
jgi:group I intron endonuclease